MDPPQLHFAALPSHDPHQAGFVACVELPCVGEGVPEPVSVQVGDARQVAAAFEHLLDALVGELAAQARPEVPAVRVSMLSAGPQVSQEGTAGLWAEGDRSCVAAFAEYLDHPQVEDYRRVALGGESPCRGRKRRGS